jgi:hypothetical protein
MKNQSLWGNHDSFKYDGPVPPTPVKMLKGEEVKQIERVKQVFPEEEGAITETFFSSRISPKGLLGEPIDKIVNLALLSEGFFKGGTYKILSIDPNVHWYFAVANLERSVETFGPVISFYLQKGGLRGKLNVKKSEYSNEFNGIGLRIKNFGSEFMYVLGPGDLGKIDVLTEQKKYARHVSYNREMEVTKPLTTQQALSYLMREVGLSHVS